MKAGETRQFTNSPIHQLTNSPTHQLTNSPTHQFTNSPKQLVDVAPYDLLENLGRARALQHTERLAGDALAREARCRRVIGLAHAAAVPVAATAIAAEEQLVLMPFQEVTRELRIARHRVVPRVCRHVAKQIRIIAEPLVGD